MDNPISFFYLCLRPILRPVGEEECLMPLPREKMTFGDTSYTKPEYQPLSKPHTRTNAHTKCRTSGRTKCRTRCQCFTPKPEISRPYRKFSRPYRKISRPLRNVSRPGIILAFFLAARRLRRFACKECVSLRRRAPRCHLSCGRCYHWCCHWCYHPHQNSH